MSIFDQPKIDCHNHILDPAGFAYGADTPYSPSGHEIGTAAQFAAVRKVYGVKHALIVGPNSGYNEDNRCLLDAIARSKGCCRGVAVVPNQVSRAELERLKAVGIAGVAFNATYHSVEHYLDTAALLQMLTELDLFVQVQVQGDQLLELVPLLLASSVRILIDHCGRPVPEQGLNQPGFQALLSLAQTGRCFVKLSGQAKFSRQSYPWGDTRPYVQALLQAFTPDACIWGSDWPFLRAPERMDYGLLLQLLEELIPDAGDRHRVLWQTPRQLLGF
jgi:predicted TIM-barrel fold metal-dependent hydrolase